ncbi:unnamed protein product [Adineta ricciae]|uniref:Glutathione peroxidase n=1 Tax=Adineta ricciae TaxID=249248 RepID=A0A814NCS3_ADIRI|nr:unnamed protein product [Adineta ricciae]
MYRLTVTIFFYLIIQQTKVNVHGENQIVNSFTSCDQSNSNENIYDFSSYDIQDETKINPISFEKYRGKVLLIIITATYCQYTRQYPYLNQLKAHYRSNNFEILAFPCNQFGLQEPGVTGEEILNGIRFVRREFCDFVSEMQKFVDLAGGNYVPNFPMFEKSDVNGGDERPVFTYLKSRCPSPVDEFHPWPNITYRPVRSNDLRWNFEKFLISPNGFPMKRFASRVTPMELMPHIDEAMARSTDKVSLAHELNELLFSEEDF